MHAVWRYIDNSTYDLNISDKIRLLCAVFAFYTCVAIFANWQLISKHSSFLGTLVKVGDKVKLKRRRNGATNDLDKDKNKSSPASNVMDLEATLQPGRLKTNDSRYLWNFSVTYHKVIENADKSMKEDNKIVDVSRSIDFEELDETHEIIHPNRKRLAWVIALVNAAITSIFGSRYLLNLWSTYGARNFFAMRLSTDLIFKGQTNLSFSICAIFLVGNVADLFYGTIFYRHFVDPFTGWFHHTLFIMLMVYVTHQTPYYSRIMMIVFAEEIPTFVLALGSIWPEYRVDLPYGILFLSFRVVFHIFVFIYAFPAVDKVICIVFGLTMIMHTIWSIGWFKSYFSPKKGKGKRKKED